MADLKLTFSDVYGQVSDFLGLGLSPTGADLTKVKDLVYRGYRRFLTPMNPKTGYPHIWTFMKQNGIVKTKGGQYIYDMPIDFDSFYSSPSLEAGENYPNPSWASEYQVKTARNESETTGYPLIFNVRAGKYSKETGQRYEILFWPDPDAVYQYEFRYLINPIKPDGDDDVFIGGVRESEVILQCSIAAAELQEDEKLGVQEAKASQILTELVLHDAKRSPKYVGEVVDPSIMHVNFGIKRPEVRIKTVDFDTS
jgi:hypothetical protein